MLKKLYKYVDDDDDNDDNNNKIITFVPTVL
jgi:hypothetical protein